MVFESVEVPWFIAQNPHHFIVVAVRVFDDELRVGEVVNFLEFVKSLIAFLVAQIFKNVTDDRITQVIISYLTWRPLHQHEFRPVHLLLNVVR